MQLKQAQREIVVNVSPTPFILLKLDDQKLLSEQRGQMLESLPGEGLRGRRE